MKETVVITGGAGDIAQTIKEYLQSSFTYSIATPRKEVLDVSNEKCVVEYMRVVKPDILINCAGYISPNKIADSSYENFKRHFDVNVFGSFLCSREAINNGCRLIINIGSTSAFESKSEWGAYCASKAALISLTETLADENIYCYSISPGRTDTKMRRALFPDECKDSLMAPGKIIEAIKTILSGILISGSHIIITKDDTIIIPKRKRPK